MSTPGHDEWVVAAEASGVAAEQVRRDHLVSHVLGGTSVGVLTDTLVFFRGTALSRTHLVDARLSEDIYLVALGPRSEVAARVESSVRRGPARSHGRPLWHPGSACGTRRAADPRC